MLTRGIIFVLSSCALLGAVLAFLDPMMLRSQTALESEHLECTLGAYPSIAATKPVFQIAHVFSKWMDDLEIALKDSGCSQDNTVLLTWEPYLGQSQDATLLPAIAAGEFDGLIRKAAEDIKNSPCRVWLRWGHEMNGDWYGWSGAKNDKSSSLYVRAYQHIHELITALNPRNLLWVWSVNGEDVPQEPWNQFEHYYPGDAFVDLVGIDAYNWGTFKKDSDGWRSAWVSPKQLLVHSYERIIKAMPNKPIVLTEIATSSVGGHKDEWIREFFALLPKRFPAIKAVIWFDVNKETDWAVSVDENTWSHFLAAAEGCHSNDGKILDWLYH